MSFVRLVFVLILSLYVSAVSAQSAPPAVFQPAPPPLPASLQFQSGIRLALYFSTLTQGGSGLVGLSGADISGARFSFRGSDQAFFSQGDGDWFALITVEMDAPPRDYEFTVVAQRGSDSVRFTRDLRIAAAGYILQAFELPADRAYLTDAAIEAAEFDLLAEIAASVSAAPLWDASGFELPAPTALTSPFGAYRTLNGGRQTRHTGWDQQAPVGTPVHAMAAGVVTLVDRLEIRGNSVMIDHGLGIYSIYAHLSDSLVQIGQRVAAGQIIGASGNTGRSSGPHLHWEIVGDGKWLDGLAFLDLWLPA